MGLENSSELFTISVNGVLYLQVCGAVLAMEVRGVRPVGKAPPDTPRRWCSPWSQA